MNAYNHLGSNGAFNAFSSSVANPTPLLPGPNNMAAPSPGYFLADQARDDMIMVEKSKLHELIFGFRDAQMRIAELQQQVALQKEVMAYLSTQLSNYALHAELVARENERSVAASMPSLEGKSFRPPPASQHFNNNHNAHNNHSHNNNHLNNNSSSNSNNGRQPSSSASPVAPGVKSNEPQFFKTFQALQAANGADKAVAPKAEDTLQVKTGKRGRPKLLNAVCASCGTSQTNFWRRVGSEYRFCNKCGLRLLMQKRRKEIKERKKEQLMSGTQTTPVSSNMNTSASPPSSLSSLPSLPSFPSFPSFPVYPNMPSLVSATTPASASASAPSAFSPAAGGGNAGNGSSSPAIVKPQTVSLLNRAGSASVSSNHSSSDSTPSSLVPPADLSQFDSLGQSETPCLPLGDSPMLSMSDNSESEEDEE
eukprot:GILK01000544.1.p1 GENE.GILK01000544.1~~GILK01000544.1.p1  ORF type:complete len:485 (+),score=95.88 GILK01000544.1:189-1457(+)